MNQNLETSLFALESVVGYKAVRYVPIVSSKVPVLKNYPNACKIGAGLVIAGAGYMMKGKLGNHVIAVGIGATLGAVFDAVGLNI